MINAIPILNIAGDLETLGVDFSGPARWVMEPDFLQLGPQWWELNADALRWTGRHLIRFRRGYRFDGASVPKPLHFFEKPGAHLPAALPHDYGYGFHWMEVWSVSRNEWVRMRVDKDWVDALFQELLLEAKVKPAKTWTLWVHVHVYGWVPWLRKTCNGRHTKCPAGDALWCPYRAGGMPPLLDRHIDDDIDDDE